MPSDYVRTLARESRALVDSIDHDPLLGGVIRGDASREHYLWFLKATYHYLRWSGPLLAETAEGLRRKGRASWLVELIDGKSSEESPHDLWVLDDLRACDVNVELLKASSPPRAVLAYVEQSRSLAEAGSPGYLGAAYTLEFISAHRAKLAANNLRTRAGIANIDKAVSFLDGHGDADTGHVALLEEVLSRLDDPQDQDDIALAAKQLRRFYPRFFARVPSVDGGTGEA
jgi:hypothetical protein